PAAARRAAADDPAGTPDGARVHAVLRLPPRLRLAPVLGGRGARDRRLVSLPARAGTTRRRARRGARRRLAVAGGGAHEAAGTGGVDDLVARAARGRARDRRRRLVALPRRARGQRPGLRPRRGATVEPGGPARRAKPAGGRDLRLRRAAPSARRST